MPKNTQGLKEDLKEELIHSLEKSLCASQVAGVLEDLRKDGVIIPKSDHENVIRFVLLLAETRPLLLENHPKNQALKKLCLSCIHQLNVTAELVTQVKKR